MTKVVYNKSGAGFDVSDKVIDYFATKFKQVIDDRGYFNHYLDDDYREIPRHDPRLIEAIESIGLAESSGEYSKLAFYELDGELYKVAEHEDGTEYVMTPETIRWINVNE